MANNYSPVPYATKTQRGNSSSHNPSSLGRGLHGMTRYVNSAADWAERNSLTQPIKIN